MTSSRYTAKEWPGLNAEEIAALQARATAEQQLRAANVWAKKHLLQDLGNDPTPTAIVEHWRDYSLIVKRVGKRWRDAEQAALDILNSALPRGGGE